MIEMTKIYQRRNFISVFEKKIHQMVVKQKFT